MKRVFVILAVLVFALGLAAVSHAATTLQGSVPTSITTEGVNGYSQQTGANGDLLTIWNSYHNLSVYGLGPVSAVTGTAGTSEVCVFCHTPHKAVTSRVLWNRNMQAWGLTTPTVDFGPLLENGEPSSTGTNTDKSITLNEDSIRCMTCHDGATSVGAVSWVAAGYQTPPISMTGSGQTGGVITQPGFFFGLATNAFGHDMSGNHPVSIPYSGSSFNGMSSTEGNFVPAASIVAWDAFDFLKGVSGAYHVECTSCHDVHGQQDPANSSTYPAHLGQMVRQGMNGSALCVVCHER